MDNEDLDIERQLSELRQQYKKLQFPEEKCDTVLHSRRTLQNLTSHTNTIRPRIQFGMSD